MKALVFYGPGEKSWDDVPEPKILQPTDVIVKMDATTICGTDLHILKGDVPPRSNKAASSATKASARSPRSARR